VTARVLVVMGTRPEAVKLAPVLWDLKRRVEHFETHVCVTGQHREMLDQALELFGIAPDHDLRIMSRDQSLADLTARAVTGLDRILARQTMDVVLVQGDTTTAFCGALAGFYRSAQVGHVEAGLRTGNRASPFPEEANRRLVSQLADYHFAPTRRAQDNLLAEGIAPASVFVTGNPVIDSLLWARDRVRRVQPALPVGLFERLDGRQVVLVTGHRRESFGSKFEGLCAAIRRIADENDDAIVVYPVHLNPNVQEPVRRILGNHDRVVLLEPLSYESFVWLMDRSTLVLTDSGGVQEEAPSLGKPVLVLRDVTERSEGVEAGNARLIGTDPARVHSEVSLLLRDRSRREAMTREANPYGDGRAASRIVDILERAVGRQ
jgi:UDP-N-acetylglucosamine 2-epimerase (non-hydrolysing)